MDGRRIEMKIFVALGLEARTRSPSPYSQAGRRREGEEQGSDLLSQERGFGSGALFPFDRGKRDWSLVICSVQIVDLKLGKCFEFGIEKDMSSAGVAALAPVHSEPLLTGGSCPAMSCMSSSESILIYLSVSGSTTPMSVLESDSIESVKLRIQTYKGFVVKKQKLVCGGRELARSNSILREYGVSDGNVMHLVLRLSDLQEINMIAKNSKEFVDLEEQEVVLDGKPLEDQKLIDDICKQNDGVLHLLVRKCAKLRAKPVEKNFELSIVASHLDDGKKQIDGENVKLHYDAGEEEFKRGYNEMIVPRKPLDRDFGLEPVIVNPKILCTHR
ncbi:hypothetical protein ACLB2K_071921 [Fragaria x ananassa]